MDTPKVKHGQVWVNRFTGTERYVRRVTQMRVFWTFFEDRPLVMEHSDALAAWNHNHTYVRDYVVQRMGYNVPPKRGYTGRPLNSHGRPRRMTEPEDIG